MKKLLITLMLIVMSTPALAKWTLIGESDNDGGYSTYADLDSAREAGGRVKMWILYDYKVEQKASGTNFSSKKIRREFNCKEGGIRTLAFSLFSWNMEKGELLRSYNQPQRWERLQPESMDELEWHVACTRGKAVQK